MADRPRVVVVGGGPVGLALAVELGLRGVACTLVERRTEPHRIPKGQNLTQRTLDLFHSWGIADELRSRRVIRPGFPGNAIVAYGDLAGAHWFTGVYRTAVDKYYFQRSERLPQYLTEQVLRDRLDGIPAVTVRAGWSAGAVRQSGDGAIVEQAGGKRRQDFHSPLHRGSNTMKTKHISRRFRRFAWANEAVSALEYAILVGVIAVGVAAALATFESQIDAALTAIGTTVGGASVTGSAVAGNN